MHKHHDLIQLLLNQTGPESCIICMLWVAHTGFPSSYPSCCVAGGMALGQLVNYIPTSLEPVRGLLYLYRQGVLSDTAF